ncbi:hypothetical protein [Pseudohoeflea coraliihabitans]|uniref:Uncharacterized protein n=1 Tax=Pseudohoeflea coraliihabitans TaxID=2860393 RepID=A0ABS6WIA4_9HYPH|nr:hypothetical protein [Pseudohoeflea sp. DP4N28-3]MBW3095671.1 hypothetical protein [Pseudohoeflea sp. DP4N28-3]
MNNHEKLASILRELTWSEMDEFAEFIVNIATDDKEMPNDAHYIAETLLEWASALAPEAAE